MANVKKALYNVAVFLVSLFITGSINVSNIKNTQDTSRVTLTVNETETLQEMSARAKSRTPTPVLIPIRGRARRASLYITKRPGNMNMTGRRTRTQ